MKPSPDAFALEVMGPGVKMQASKYLIMNYLYMSKL